MRFITFIAVGVALSGCSNKKVEQQEETPVTVPQVSGEIPPSSRLVVEDASAPSQLRKSMKKDKKKLVNKSNSTTFVDDSEEESSEEIVGSVCNESEEEAVESTAGNSDETVEATPGNSEEDADETIEATQEVTVKTVKKAPVLDDVVVMGRLGSQDVAKEMANRIPIEIAELQQRFRRDEEGLQLKASEKLEQLRMEAEEKFAPIEEAIQRNAWRLEEFLAVPARSRNLAALGPIQQEREALDALYEQEEAAHQEKRDLIIQELKKAVGELRAQYQEEAAALRQELEWVQAQIVEEDDVE